MGLSEEAKETIIASVVMGTIIIAVIGLIFGWWNPFVGVEEDSDERFNVPLMDSPTLGSRDAPVKIIEFSDFSCRACAQFALESKEHLQEYIDEGTVSLTFKHYPLSAIHPRSLQIANAAECAREQEAFWEYHKKVFENQELQEVGHLRGFAQELSLNTTSFDECLNAGKHYPRIQIDIREGNLAGVRATPTFFINGKRIVGVLSPERLTEEIRLALTQE